MLMQISADSQRRFLQIEFQGGKYAAQNVHGLYQLSKTCLLWVRLSKKNFHKKNLHSSNAKHREDYKRSLRESLKAQMQESADKRRHEFNTSRSESMKAISDFHSSR